MIISFSKEMNHDSVVIAVNGEQIDVEWSGLIASYSPAEGWSEDADYTIIVNGMDIYGNHMQQYCWEFHTEILPVPVEGVIKDNKGNPVSGATITVDGEVVATTNETGHYSFEVMPGNHTMTVSKEGFEDSTKEVDVIKDTPIELDVEMQSPMDLLIPIGIICAIAALILIMFAVGRRRKKEE
jgi:hypothetical protein